MNLPSFSDAANGAFACSAIRKLQAIGLSDCSTQDKRQQAYPAIVELRAFLDAQFNSPAFGMLLTMARVQNKAIADKKVWLNAWERIKSKMGSDGKYVAFITDKMPAILARYTALTGIRIFGDPDMREIVLRGIR